VFQFVFPLCFGVSGYCIDAVACAGTIEMGLLNIRRVG
jgi:hypothetical protein